MVLWSAWVDNPKMPLPEGQWQIQDDKAIRTSLQLKENEVLIEKVK